MQVSAQLFFIMCMAPLVSVAQVTTFPYFEDFESGDGGWYAVNSDANGWERGTPVFGAPFSGTQAWKTNLDGNYSPGGLYYLYSPEFDFTSFTADPQLSFKLQHYGGVFLTASTYVEYSLDQSQTWQVLGKGGGMWYTEPRGWFHDLQGWFDATNVLAGMGGQPSVIFRIVLEATPLLYRFPDDVFWGAIIDDISIGDATPSVFYDIMNVQFPSGPNLGTNEQVTLTLRASENQITEMDLVIDLWGPIYTPDFEQRHVTGLNITPGNPYDLVVNNLNFSKPGFYSCAIAVESTEHNDLAVFNVFHSGGAHVNTFPYVEDFESGDGGFFASTTIDELSEDTTGWEYGIPSTPVNNAAHSGTKAWFTDMVAPYSAMNRFHLYTPEFDFTSFTEDPILSFYINHNVSNEDQIYMEYSVDNGLNWYLVRGIPYYISAYWTDDSGGWKRMEYRLRGFEGQPSVFFRIIVIASNSSEAYEGVAIDDFIIANGFADAGSDIVACNTTTTNLTANEPIIGRGFWNKLTGEGGTFGDRFASNTTFTGMPGETYTLRWAVEGPYTWWWDLLIVEIPAANAGEDKVICTTQLALEGDVPIGAATWTILSGENGSFSDISDTHALFTYEPGTAYELRLTATHGTCEVTDEVVFIPLTQAEAGKNVMVCDSIVALSANTPYGSETGSWDILNETPGTVGILSDPYSDFFGHAGITYSLTWTINDAASGCSSSDTVTITLKPSLSKPFIELQGGNDGIILMSSASSSQTSHWYRDDELTSTATTSALVITENGVYTLQIEEDECLSPVSDPFPVTITAAAENGSDHISVLPNPVKDRLVIKLGDTGIHNRITLIDSKGALMKHYSTRQNELEVDATFLTPGIYFVSIVSDNKAVVFRKIVKH